MPPTHSAVRQFRCFATSVRMKLSKPTRACVPRAKRSRRSISINRTSDEVRFFYFARGDAGDFFAPAQTRSERVDPAIACMRWPEPVLGRRGRGRLKDRQECLCHFFAAPKLMLQIPLRSVEQCESQGLKFVGEDDFVVVQLASAYVGILERLADRQQHADDVVFGQVDDLCDLLWVESDHRAGVVAH